MKRILPFILLNMLILSLNAQNWQTVQLHKQYFFKCDTILYTYINAWNVEGVKVDSAGVSGSDSVFYNFKTQREIMDTTSCMAERAPSWLGSHILVNASGANVFFNAAEDSVLIQTRSLPGASWTFYRFSNGSYFRASVDSSLLGNVSGVADSLKFISLQFVDSSGSPAAHPFNGKQLLLSENHGVVDLFDLYDFPASTFSFRQSPQHLMTIGEIYDYNVGDEFGYSYSHAGEPPGSYRIKTITYKYVSPPGDSVFYQYSMFDKHYFLVSGSPPSVSSTVNTYPGTESFGNLSGLLYTQMPREVMDPPLLFNAHEIDQYNMILDTGLYGNLLTCELPFGQYIWNGSCYEPGSIGPDYGIQTFISGCGSFENGRLDGSAIPAVDDHEALVYIHKGSFTWGHSPLMTGVGELSSGTSAVFPNPSTGVVNMRIAGNEIPKRVKVFDRTGRLVRTIDIENTAGPDLFRIDLSNLESGIYFLQAGTVNYKISILK